MHVYCKCTNQGTIGIEKVYEYKSNVNNKLILNLIPMNILCLMILGSTMSMPKVLK